MVSHDASQGKSVHAVPFFVHVKVADGHVKQPVVQHTATIAATAVMVIVTAASGGGSAASGGVIVIAAATALVSIAPASINVQYLHIHKYNTRRI